MLLAILVTGIAFMHTLGHEHDDRAEMPTSSMVSAHTVGEMPGTAHHSSAISESSSSNAGGSHAPLDPSTMCLAILVALGLALGLPLLLHRVGAEESSGLRRLSIRRWAVPDVPSLSVILTRVVVLRN
ncbi:hypothetical protein [Microbispora catharanthi]|uniref:Uncharacterized protein n=1 Tax=Microbispora catharanthi TaxID=1712871 RepID=A0A5N6BLZ8_9ACTN|nr:hypothetical protein [Microbispora catharanthi]KAB8180859.1 hypothetical protein FH610_031835 [Microbispora catharanthi]